MKELLIAVAVALVGCAAPAGTPEARISPEFSSEERDIIYSALFEWCEAAPEACPPSISVVDDPRLANIQRIPGPAVAGVWGKASKYDRIALHPDEPMEAGMLANVVRHEVAHWIGSEGHSSDGHATHMHAEEGSCISQVDIDRVCRGRGGCYMEAVPSCD